MSLTTVQPPAPGPAPAAEPVTETRRQRLNRPVSVLTAYRRATAIKPVPERAIQPELLV